MVWRTCRVVLAVVVPDILLSVPGFEFQVAPPSNEYSFPAPGVTLLFARKMEESMSSPSESKIISMPKAGAEPKKYSVDPYREPPSP